MTKIFLAATSHVKSPIVGKHKPHYLLESFLDLKSKSKKTDEYVQWRLTADSFLLDSGAFALRKMDLEQCKHYDKSDY